MTSGGNNFNYFPENQLTKFKLCPPTYLFPPRISVTHFASPGVPLIWDARTPLSIAAQLAGTKQYYLAKDAYYL